MTIRAALSLHEDSPILLAHILKKDKAWLYANQDNNLTAKQSNKFESFVRKRVDHWPVAYLTGHKEFFGLDFFVTPDVLIPRPETELLVEKALEILRAKSYELKAVVDIGTGSGCINISLAKTLREYHRLVYDTIAFYEIDVSKQALAIARRNARRHKVASKIKFLHGNLLEPLLKAKSYQLEAGLILANLPYLTTKQLQNPQFKHEPKTALDGGRDGLKYFRELFSQLSSLPTSYKLQANILLEHDPSQKAKLKALAKQYLPRRQGKLHKDLAKKYRVLEIQI